MPITEERMTSLLAAVEDQEAALAAAKELVRLAAARVGNGGDPGTEIATLALMMDPDLLLTRPLMTRLAIQRERDHWTEARVKENERKRRKMAERRKSYNNGESE